MNALDYLRLLSKQVPSIQAASTDVIDLAARLDLPKGTEHFISDIHGEYEAFSHLMRSGSGSIRRRIDEIFGEALSQGERRNLATLIAYPERKLPLVLRAVEDQAAWYRRTLARLVRVCRSVMSKYPRSQVRVFLPDHLAEIVEDLLYAQEDSEDKRDYYRRIVETIISTGSGKAFVVALAELIQDLAFARLHVIGDIYDRGPGAHLVMDALMEYHSVDIQWGNHDVLWMGAASGSAACIANVVRISLRYANTETMERGYAIRLLPLASLAIDTYGDDPCEQFIPRPSVDEDFTEDELMLMARMQKAIAIIQFKLEAQIIQRRSHYHMEDRLLLDKIDHDRGTVHLNGVDYPLLDTNFPTVDPEHPYQLTAREKSVMEKLTLSFTGSRRLQEHVRFLLSKGSIYCVHNGNLLYHGCIPMNEDGTFNRFKVDGEEFSAKDFMDRVDRLVRQGYFSTDDPAQKEYGMDAMWYLWSGAQSPLFGKRKMATFERYFIADQATHAEERDPYYDLREREDVARRILQAFGVDPDKGHIINGHVPVRVKHGESPVKAGGQLIVIDGGLCKAYQERTGIAGYTLVFNSWGLLLATHRSFGSTQRAIEEDVDLDSRTEILEDNTVRIRVRDTDLGRDLQRRIDELTALLDAYRDGVLKEG